MISALIRPANSRHRTAALIVLVGALFWSGCGSPNTDFKSGVPGTAKERAEEERYKYEGTGKAKAKTLVRRQDARFKEILEADKKKE